ncbi:MAG: tRNA(Ile)-lysidine synthetase, partial [Gammaproteobacteria bacterium]|nr:tRNA(Ile)-lysidine synthetase [Gammaproteobacteria bacterium]
MDSTLLLYALYRLRRSGSLSTPLAAIHIHHGLQQEADLWQQQCQQYC